MNFTNKTLSILVSVFLTSSILAGCASAGKVYHKYIMRGQVLNVAGNQVYLCIGSKDGAEVGQEYVVYYNVQSAADINTGLSFSKVKTGIVKISEIVNEHYAKGILVSGKADKHSIVELER